MRKLTATRCLTVALVLHSHSVISEEYKTIYTREGVTISFIKNTPSKHIRAAAILLAGGNGDIGIDVENETVGSRNFLVRTRSLFSKNGFLTLTPDLPSDMDSLKNDRGNIDYLTDLSFLVKQIREQTGKPIWLVGTSRGSITVSYHAAALDIQGIVLTSTVTTGKHDTVFSGYLEKIKVPALIVHHEDDECSASPARYAKEIMHALNNSPKKIILSFREGESGDGRHCGPISPHGFLGIEDKVIGTMSNWMFKAIRKRQSYRVGPKSIWENKTEAKWAKRLKIFDLP